MDNDYNNLHLIYVKKVGKSTTGDGLYEFIFSKDETNIDIEGWCWDKSPACEFAEPPSEEYYDKIIELKTKEFELFCLHEAFDREYMQGYYTIHALAYETYEEPGCLSYEQMFDGKEELPLLVFHYGITLTKVIDMFKQRDIILKNNKFIQTSTVTFEEEYE